MLCARTAGDMEVWKNMLKVWSSRTAYHAPVVCPQRRIAIWTLERAGAIMLNGDP